MTTMQEAPLRTLSQANRRHRPAANRRIKSFGAAFLLACGSTFAAGSALALQVAVTKVDKNADGTSTYHFAVRTDQGETLMPDSDFVTVYNFAGLVEGSAKTPPGWAFSSEDFGRTPTWEGYPAVLPVDVPGLSNLTWSAKKPIAGQMQITGFTATTRAGTTTDGEYTTQVTRSEAGKPEKQAIIGHIPTPDFLSR
jgi:hypothetical protein